MWYSRALEYKAMYALRVVCGIVVCVLSVVHLLYLSTLFLPPPPTSLSSHPLPSRPCFSSSKVIVVIFMIVVGFTKFDPELLHPLVPPAHNFEPTAEDKANVSAVGREREECTAGVGSSSIVFNLYTYYLSPTPSSHLNLSPSPPPTPAISIPFHSILPNLSLNSSPCPSNPPSLSYRPTSGVTGNVLLRGWWHSRRRHPSIL